MGLERMNGQRTDDDDGKDDGKDGRTEDNDDGDDGTGRADIVPKFRIRYCAQGSNAKANRPREDVSHTHRYYLPAIDTLKLFATVNRSLEFLKRNRKTNVGFAAYVHCNFPLGQTTCWSL